MKLRNKKTGEIADLDDRGLLKSDNNKHIIVYPEGTLKYYAYNSLAELNEEWEDYEEPKKYWFINSSGCVLSENDEDAPFDIGCKKIGNYFETRAEAEKAVEKLRAWKRLKDKWFRFSGWEIDQKKHLGVITIKTEPYYSFEFEDLDLLFGGEE